MPPRPLSLPFAVAVVLGLPALARGATVTLDEPEVSQEECLARASYSVELSWDLGSSSGSSVEILGSDASGCSETDATTAVVVDNLSTSQTSYPQTGDSILTLAAVLSAAGRSSETCQGSDAKVYVCVRLLDGSGNEVAIGSASLTLQLEKPPSPVDVSVSVGEQGLWVSWAEGTATTDAPASSKTYRAFASANGATYASTETTGTSAHISGLQDGTIYDVWVVAYSSAGNPSDDSTHTTGTPQDVLTFWDLYEQSGGKDAGGCSHGGGAGLLSLLGVGWVVRRARRRAGGGGGAPGQPHREEDRP
ncbi:fibronectin type III domain-containing protein [Anaeromyxobacter oryzisoli]|uniref:fibronectin type III domain-containing protein n=1 Tax=Anaeromyxobacter oryzisoli TaxID=2925408 RepID=UPI001F56E3C3|nr:fibronectin type III domain-containing protein [Anaeromyxobacter sp. SG63]